MEFVSFECIYEIAHLQLKREKERNYWLECLADFIHCIFRLAIITDFHHLDVIVFGMVLAFTHRNEFVIWAFVFGLYRCSFRHVFLFLLSSGCSLFISITIAQTRTYCSFTYSLFWNIWFEGRKENETNLVLMKNAECTRPNQRRRANGMEGGRTS